VLLAITPHYRAQPAAVTPGKPARHEHGAEAGHGEHGRLRERHDYEAGEPRGDAPPNGRLVLEEADGQQHERDRRGDVDAVRRRLRRVPNERDAEGEQRHGDERGAAPEHACGQAPEEDERRQATEEREEPHGELARAERHDRELLDEEKALRGDLIGRERAEQQQPQWAPDGVARQGDLVEPERRVRGVLPQAQRRADGEQPDHHGALARERVAHSVSFVSWPGVTHETPVRALPIVRRSLAVAPKAAASTHETLADAALDPGTAAVDPAETQVRRGLEQTLEALTGLYEGSPTRTVEWPTGMRILHAFARAQITLTHVEETDSRETTVMLLQYIPVVMLGYRANLNKLARRCWRNLDSKV
jgi:hypothetical protein